MIYEEIERAREAFEERLIPEIADLYAAQGDEIIAAVRGSTSPQWAVLDAERVAADVSLAMETLALIWGTVGPAFASAAYEGLTPAKRAPTNDEWLQEVLAFIENEGGVMVRAITDTVLGDIREVLVQGAEEGEGIAAMARRMRQVWPEITMQRAERICRTEIIASSNHSSIMGYEKAARDFGLELEIEWIATAGDGRTRDSHRAADGQRVPLGGLFTVGGESARYPGDPRLSAGNRIQCRCATAAVPKDAKSVTLRLDQLNERERGRVELAMRDLSIRTAYPELRQEVGQLEAIARLAERHATSESTVKSALGWK